MQNERENIQVLSQDYQVDENGRIKAPGKFEGEMIYVPYFWDLGNMGFADHENDSQMGFEISDDDRRLFPSLNNRQYLTLEESNDGFVCEI